MLKVITFDYEKSQQKMVKHAVQQVLRQTVNPNTPMIPGGEKPYWRIRCNECDEIDWRPQGSHLCLDCKNLEDMEVELDRRVRRMERENRMRELEEKLAQ